MNIWDSFSNWTTSITNSIFVEERPFDINLVNELLSLSRFVNKLVIFVLYQNFLALFPASHFLWTLFGRFITLSTQQSLRCFLQVERFLHHCVTRQRLFLTRYKWKFYWSFSLMSHTFEKKITVSIPKYFLILMQAVTGNLSSAFSLTFLEGERVFTWFNFTDFQASRYLFSKLSDIIIAKFSYFRQNFCESFL